MSEHLKAVKFHLLLIDLYGGWGTYWKFRPLTDASSFAFFWSCVSLSIVSTRAGVQQGCVIARPAPVSLLVFRTAASVCRFRDCQLCLSSCVELSVTFLASLTVCYLPWPQALCDVTLYAFVWNWNRYHFWQCPWHGLSAFSSQSSQVCVLVLERVLAVMGHLPWVRLLPNQSWGGGRQGGDSWDQPQARKPRSPVVLSQSSVVFLEKVFCKFYMPLIVEMVVFDHLPSL